MEARSRSRVRQSPVRYAALGQFSAQWSRYQGAVETVGRRLASAQRAFEDLSGPRTRQLERQLEPIDRLRQEHGIVVPELAESVSSDMEDEEAETGLAN